MNTLTPNQNTSSLLKTIGGRKKASTLILAFSISFGFLFAQKAPYQFPEKFPEFYNFHAEEAFGKLNKNPLYGLDEKESSAFRMATIYGLQQVFDQNEAYLDWIQAEDYLKKIYDTLIPKYYKDKSNMQLFVARDPSMNAWANDNGFLFINIGLLASVRNEAALAATIGHETGHAVYDHGYNKYVDYMIYKRNHPQVIYNAGKINSFYSRNYEATADTFSYVRMAVAGYNLKSVKGKFEIYDQDLKRDVHTSLSAFGDGSMSRVKNYLSTYSSHPMNEARVKMADYYAAKVSKPGRNYIVDSVVFNKIRKFAQEECKKILFENADYKECLRRSFVDYLYNEKNLKNLYYIIECIRRLEYVTPELGKKGFLADEYSDKEFVEYNYSILKKTELLFLDSIQEAELSSHPLLADPAKPFNNYDEAMIYFCNKAKALGFNESNFSLGLYYYAKKDEDNFIFYTGEYIKGNGGINTEFAATLLQNKRPILTGNKMLFIYDNSGINAEDNFWNGSNYYQIKVKRNLNKEVAPILAEDTAKVKLVFVNEFLGTKPRELHHYQKLEKQTISLYNKEEKQLFRKKRISSKESIDEIGLTHKYTKNLFIYAPELYTWFKSNDYGSMCFANISYDYDEALALKEIRNDYTSYYFNFNVTRPYFKTGIRSLSVKKQTDLEISKELVDFLYGKD